MKSFVDLLMEEETDDETLEMIIDFILDIDEDTLSDDMKHRYFEIIELINEFGEDEALTFEDENDTDDEDDMEEGGIVEAAKKVRISRILKAQRKRLYRKNKAKLKLKAKRFRKTAAFKKYKKKAKRMQKLGKTASGKRKRTFI